MNESLNTEERHLVHTFRLLRHEEQRDVLKLLVQHVAKEAVAKGVGGLNPGWSQRLDGNGPA